MQNIGIGAKRIFLESRRYYGTKIERILFLFQIKRVIRSGFVLLRTTVYQMLWSFTIIGFFIKKYAYYMVPFIVAENPDIKGKDAITLSRQMMNGYKWKMFVMDLTFLGWSILNAVTFGLLGIFFINPYRTATDTEVYIALRRRAIEEKLPLAALFTDQYLDVEKAVDAEYPIESFPIPIAEHRKWLNIDYRKNYSIQHLILIYFCFAFIGWCWEVGLHLMSDGTFVNRGVLFGPWLPIYGTGGILVLVLLKPFREKRILTFALSTLICGIVEYTTSYYLEMTHGMKWWDYSGYFLNINGRVCFEGLLVFGLGCLSIIYVVAPLLDNLLSKIPKKLGWAIAVLLLVLFIADNIHAKDHPNVGKGITDYQSRIDSEQNVNKIAKFI